MDLIHTESLTKKFGEFVAVNEVTLTVAAGEILALLGPNGAGKTTTVRMLGSILKPTSGCATIAGYDVVRDARDVRSTVGLLTEFPGLYHRMRADEYLHFFGELQGLSCAQREKRIEELMKRFGMWDARKKRLGEYSKGMRQKIALIRALIHDPRVLFLDEPTSAMDPRSAKTVRDAIAELRSSDRAIILCTHNLAEAETLADRIAIIKEGGIIALGTPRQLKSHLLGNPLLEMRLGQPLDGLLPAIESLVTVEEKGDDWFRYRTDVPAEINPLLVRRLSEEGARIVTLSEVARSLEEVYLRIVEERE
ncbi:MAG TPA: ABC transporter ATP-binding protein [Anaerolineae bacterium]|nr:ABC transporter ATP-binding protein [Anaerolineae bacterium]